MISPNTDEIALRLLERGPPHTDDETPIGRFARKARRIFDVPMALVRLVPESLLIGGMVDAYALGTDGVLVVEDATRDVRFAESAIVAGPPNIRFVAACAMRAWDGAVLGTVSILDRKVRTFSQANRNALWALADELASSALVADARARARLAI